MSIRLGVNIDHVATVRQARGVAYPDPVEAALCAIQAGADGITLHLREDRRHIQDEDLQHLMGACTVPINLEMAATESMIGIAEQYQPAHCCLVPEKREEITTEGGLDVAQHTAALKTVCHRLSGAGIEVSLFIDPDIDQIEGALACGVPTIELHTGDYANATVPIEQELALSRLRKAATYAKQKGLLVNAGHGLHYENVVHVAALPELNELNIGHSIVSEALFIGFEQAVRKMKFLCESARSSR